MRATLQRLIIPDDIRVYAETCFGAAYHWLAAGAQRREGTHTERHEGLARWLRARGLRPEADAFAELETMRIGRWYGKQGNGTAAARMAELLARIQEWSLASEGDR